MKLRINFALSCRDLAPQAWAVNVDGSLLRVMALKASAHLKDIIVGNPQRVIDKMLYEHELFGKERFPARMSKGFIPHKQMMRSVEIFWMAAPGAKKPG